MSGWLDRLREVGEKATPGEWTATDHGQEIAIASIEFHVAQIDTSYDSEFDREQCDRDAEFIVLARNTWPLLVAVAEAGERAEVTHNHGGVGPKVGCAGCELTDALASLREAVTE